MSHPAVPTRPTARVAALCLLGLFGPAGPAVAQFGTDPRENRTADMEFRRRLEPMIPSIRAALEGKDPDAQRAALTVIGDVPPSLSAEASPSASLPSFLHPLDVTGWYAARWDLVTVRASLHAYLQRPATSPQLTALALRALGKTHPDGNDIRILVTPHVNSEIAEVRRAAAEALSDALTIAAPAARSVANAGYFIEVAEQSLPLLATGLDDTAMGTQKAALTGLSVTTRTLTGLVSFDSGPIGRESAPRAGGGRLLPFIQVFREVVKLVPHLASPLASRDPETRATAARALEALAVFRRAILSARPGQPDPLAGAWPPIRQAVADRLKDPSPAVRLAVVEALESLSDAVETRGLLREAAADKSSFVRWAAARALGAMAPPKATEAIVAPDLVALEPLTRDPDIDVRIAALTALTRLGPTARGAIPAVQAAASRGDVEPRVAAIGALWALDSPAKTTVPILIEGLQDKDVRVRRAAAGGLTRFGPDARPALPELRKALNDEDPELRLLASEAVLSIERKPRLKDL